MGVLGSYQLAMVAREVLQQFANIVPINIAQQLLFRSRSLLFEQVVISAILDENSELGNGEHGEKQLAAGFAPGNWGN